MRWWKAECGVLKRVVQMGAAIALTIASPAWAADRLVLAFGDSLTAGYRLAPTASFPAQLEAALRKGGTAARVHNAGVSGDTSAAGKARLGWVLTGLKAKPDLVILELGANDMLRSLNPAETRANLDAMLGELKRRGIPVILAGMLASPNLGPEYRRSFDAIYPALAKKHGATLYPFFMQGVTGNPRLLIADGMHPNAQGVAVVVRGLAPVVKAKLSGK